MHIAEQFGQQTIRGHRIEYSRLAQQHHKDHRCETRDHRQAHQDVKQRKRNFVQCKVKRGRNVELFVIHNAGEHIGIQNEQNGANHQRSDDTDRHVALRIFGLLRGGGYSIETNVGEEDRSRSRQDAAPAEVTELASVGRDKRNVIGVVDVTPSNRDEHYHHGDFQKHDDRIHQSRLLNPDHQDGRDQHYNEHSGQVDQTVNRSAIGKYHWLEWRSDQTGRQVNAEFFE